MHDLLLKGGRVLDPANHIDGRFDVAVHDGRIAAMATDLDPASARKVIEVGGRLVVPGLIDIHVHAHHTRAPEGLPEGLSVHIDAHVLRSGVTTVVDTGTAGPDHFDHFRRTVIDRSTARILAFVNVVDRGMLGDWEQDPRNFVPEAAAATVAANSDVCVGIKTAHYRATEPWDDLHTPWAAVDAAIAAAELCGKPVMYDFWPRPERTYEDLLLRKARPGDIHTHVYAQQFPILDANGKPNAFLFEARRRGIVFDVGHGAASFWFRNAEPALAGGFGPDSISTDLHLGNVSGCVLDMTTTMGKMLAIGMPLEEVVMRSTVAPAREIGHPELGTLSVGACADVAVLDVRHGDFRFVDCGGGAVRSDRRIECALTLRAGRIVHNGAGLGTPDWRDAPASYFECRPAGMPARPGKA
ncbi:MAG: amidohydrolase family protein [Armatimonadota bacterium]